MPSANNHIDRAGMSIEEVLELSIGAFDNQGWDAKYAGPNLVVGYTKGTWSRRQQEITVEVSESAIIVTSRMIFNELLDIGGRNKRNIQVFLGSFEQLRSAGSLEQKEVWGGKLATLRANTLVEAEKEVKEAAEVDKVMRLSGSNLYLTYSIIGVNLVVYVAMVASGVDFMSPDGLDVLRWGANYGPLTLSGDWWRLISCVFVHIGLIHLAFNMYALYMVGVYLEPMLGKWRFGLAYVCTGITASLASLWWHDTPVPSAGASGAIFGMYGVFLSLLTTQLVPPAIRKSLLQSIVIFVIYNLAYGMKSGVDNSAHIGGLLGGIVFGYGYYLVLRPAAKARAGFVVAAGLGLATVILAFVYLKGNEVDQVTRRATEEEIKAAAFRDNEKYNAIFQKIIQIQDTAVGPYKMEGLSEAERASRLRSVSLPAWERAKKLASQLNGLDVSQRSKEKAGVLVDYLGWKLRATELDIQRMEDKNIPVDVEMEALNAKITAAIEDLERP